MPRHRRRSGRPRLLVSATFGALALAIVVYAVAEPALPSDSMGAVGGIQGAPLGPADVQAADVQAAAIESPGTLPTEPEVTAGTVPGEPSAPSAPTAAFDDGGAALDKRAIAEIAPRPVPLAWLSGYQSPLPNGRITLPFGPSKWGSRVVDGEPFHDGLDLATFCGDRIVAAHDGVVLAAGRRYDRYMGWVGDLQPYLDRLEAKSLWSTLPMVVVIDDGNGYRSMYAHLSKVEVEKGDAVRAGDLLGYEGRTGRASGCHLHYGLFSPEETAVFGIDPGVVERMLLPPWQIARVDPQLVLPEQTRARPKATPSPVSDFAKPPIE